MAAIVNKKEQFIKFIIIFLVYLCYTQIFSSIFNLFGVNDSITISFVADLIFFFGIIYVYKDVLKKEFNDFVKKNPFLKQLKIILAGVFGIILINILGGMITDLIFREEMIDENTSAIYSLGSISTIYTIFKVTLFSAIAEELVFRKTTRDVISDNIIFVIVSGLIYGLMNVAYSAFSVVSMVDLIQCFLLGVFIAFYYIKTNNIVAVMIMKFVYTLIPLTIMFMAIGG